jgi:hypothetical protein
MSMSATSVNGNTPNFTNALSNAGQGLAPGIQSIVGQSEADLKAQMAGQEQLKVLGILAQLSGQASQIK